MLDDFHFWTIFQFSLSITTYIVGCLFYFTACERGGWHVPIDSARPPSRGSRMTVTMRLLAEFHPRSFGFGFCMTFGEDDHVGTRPSWLKYMTSFRKRAERACPSLSLSLSIIIYLLLVITRDYQDIILLVEYTAVYSTPSKFPSPGILPWPLSLPRF